MNQLLYTRSVMLVERFDVSQLLDCPGIVIGKLDHMLAQGPRLVSQAGPAALEQPEKKNWPKFSKFVPKTGDFMLGIWARHLHGKPRLHVLRNDLRSVFGVGSLVRRFAVLSCSYLENTVQVDPLVS